MFRANELLKYFITFLDIQMNAKVVSSIKTEIKRVFFPLKCEFNMVINEIFYNI